MINIKYEITDELLIPFYAKLGDSGMDIMASKEIVIKRGQTMLVPTGLKLEIPLGFEVQIRPRSGLSYNTPLRIANTPGTIDSGYRNEIKVIVTNISVSGFKTYDITEKGNKHGTYIIHKYDRIAQLVLSRVETINLIKGDLDYKMDRMGGIGSTGVRGYSNA